MFNLLKTAVLMAAITALFMAIGAYVGGQRGMLFALWSRSASTSSATGSPTSWC